MHWINLTETKACPQALKFSKNCQSELSQLAEKRREYEFNHDTARYKRLQILNKTL